MGAVLYKIFKIVESEGGVSARLKFAQATKVSLERVKRVKDKPEYVAKFSKIANTILDKDITDLLPAIKKPVIKKSSKKPVKKPVKASKKAELTGKDDDILL